MYCTRKVTDKITWIGGEDRRLALFENVYPIPTGVSYNSYFIDDEKTLVMDTVDRSVSGQFFENIAHMLGGRRLDYLVVNHMEPDHAATVYELMLRYPDTTIVCNAKIRAMLDQFFHFEKAPEVRIVKEGGRHGNGAGRHPYQRNRRGRCGKCGSIQAGCGQPRADEEPYSLRRNRQGG